MSFNEFKPHGYTNSIMGLALVAAPFFFNFSAGDSRMVMPGEGAKTTTVHLSAPVNDQSSFRPYLTSANRTKAILDTFIRTVNFDNKPNGAYGLSHARQDFGNALYWNTFNSQVVNKQLRTTLAKILVGPTGGTMSRFNLPRGTAYEVQFDMMFDNNFEFSKGGKVGFGLLIGDGFTGGGSATSGEGGSARIMWFENKGRVYLKPYLYHKDMPGNWGDDRGLSFPQTGSIQKGTWYKVKMYVKSNTGFNSDGRIRILVNGTTMIDQPIRWTTNDSKRFITRLSFETFRGGSEDIWVAATDGDIYFDNVSFKQISL